MAFNYILSLRHGQCASDIRCIKMNFQNKVTLLVMQENLTQYNDPSTTEQENGVTFRNNNTLEPRPTDQ